MTSLTTFFLSGIIGKEAFDSDGDAVGVIKDLLISAVPSGRNDPDSQLVIGVRLKVTKRPISIPSEPSESQKPGRNSNVTCSTLVEL